MKVDLKCPECGQECTREGDFTLRVRDGKVRHMDGDEFADNCPACGSKCDEIKEDFRIKGLANFTSRPGGRVCK